MVWLAGRPRTFSRPLLVLLYHRLTLLSTKLLFFINKQFTHRILLHCAQTAALPYVGKQC